MRKMSILFLAVVLIVGMSVGVMAVDVPVSITTSPYAAIYFVTDYFDVNGLFGSDPLAGDPGLYVSDGNATVDYVSEYLGVSGNAWGISPSIVGSSLLPVNDDNVDVFMVDTNTNATVNLTWTSSSNWPDRGLHALFRTSSNLSIPDPNHNGPAATPPTDDPFLANLVSLANGVDQDWDDDTKGAQVHAEGESDSFTVTPEQCVGPYLYHLNGALFLEKADSILAGPENEVGMILTLTVEAN